MASSTADYEQVAEEYKAVLSTDPQHAPTYMKLGRLYAKLGNEVGHGAFGMAVYYFTKCKSVCQAYSDSADVELAIVEALQKKYKNGPIQFVGRWGSRYEYSGTFDPMVEISYSNNKLLFNPIEEGEIIEKKETENGIKCNYERVHDYREELRRKRWTHYYDDCDDNADAGHPTTGIYKYDKDITRFTVSYYIEDGTVYRQLLSEHCEYYFQGRKAYAETPAFLPQYFRISLTIVD